MVTEIRIQAIKMSPMTEEALLHYAIHSRKYFANTKICRGMRGISVSVSEFDTPDKVAKVVWRNYGSGEFYIMGRSHAKTKTKNKPVRLCKIQIHDLGNEEYSYQISQTWRLKQRYKWFWKGV